jgi:hypothetical protein
MSILLLAPQKSDFAVHTAFIVFSIMIAYRRAANQWVLQKYGNILEKAKKMVEKFAGMC